MGFTDDLKHVLDRFNEKNDSSESKKAVYLSGYSLGANVVVKLLGELGVAAQVSPVKFMKVNVSMLLYLIHLVFIYTINFILFII